MRTDIKRRFAIMATVTALAGAAVLGLWLFSVYDRAVDVSPSPISGGLAESEEDHGSTKVDWEYWLSVNPDIVAWVSVPGTDIDYPVVQASADDPTFYLDHDVYRGWNPYGCPYLDAGCAERGIDSPLALMFAHHMNDGSMFASLRNFDNPEFGMNHVIEYNTIEGATGFGSYQLLGCWYEDLTAPNPYRYWDQVGELTEQQFNDYVANIKQLSMYETGVNATYGDDLLALSTCSYGTADERFIVVGVKTK